MRSLLKIVLLLIPIGLQGQIDTYWIDTTTTSHSNFSFFFTNRPVKKSSKKGYFTFKNKSTKKTDNLFFCMYDHEEDSILIRYRAKNISDFYPVDTIEDNIFYKIYDDLRIRKGIRKFSIIVPGYSHTFNDQLRKFMKGIKSNYSDSVQNIAAQILYAWGDEWRPYRYYSAKTSAKRGANDFAIFQHMLEDFLSDSVFFSTHPSDISFTLTCTSMGNQLLKKYLLEREKQGIRLSKVYKKILLIGSDTSWDSFEEGKGFDNIGELCDSVIVVWHEKDLPLKVSKTMNATPRMGLYGPHEPDSLPGYIRTLNVRDMLEKGDKSGLWHNYLLTNPTVQKMILEGLKEDED